MLDRAVLVTVSELVLSSNQYFSVRGLSGSPPLIGVWVPVCMWIVQFIVQNGAGYVIILARTSHCKI